MMKDPHPRRGLGLVLGLLAVFFMASHTVRAEDGPIETATFSMYCYWTGEATLGRVEGVVASRIGHWGGAEIVQVDFDPRLTDRRRLAEALKSRDSFDSVIASSPQERRRLLSTFETAELETKSGEPRFIEPKHSLRTRHPELLRLELTEAQAIALNSWSYFGGPMPDVLRPEQKARLAKDD